MSAFYIILLILVVCVSLLLLLLVLMQRPRQEGLGATFGVDVTSQMFGSRTTDVLQKGTVYLTIVLFALCITLGLLNARTSKKEAQLGRTLAEQAMPEPAKPLEAPETETTPPAAGVLPAPGDAKPAETPPPADTTPATPPAPGTPAPNSAAPEGKAPDTPPPAPAETPSPAPPSSPASPPATPTPTPEPPKTGQ